MDSTGNNPERTEARANPRRLYVESDTDIRRECIRLLYNMDTTQLRNTLATLITIPHARKTETIRLSDREKQVLTLVANGYSRAEIAATLTISPNTAARHIANTYAKLDVSTVAEATCIAIASGLVAVADPYGSAGSSAHGKTRQTPP